MLPDQEPPAHTRFLHQCLRLCLISIALTLVVSHAALAAPKSKLWVMWAKHNLSTTETIDHSAWQSLLDRYLVSSNDGINRFKYANVDAQGKQQLQGYIDSLTALPVGNYSRDEQYAYWVNLYNAVTIDVIIDNYPVDSIRDISSGFFSKGPWDEKLLVINQQDVSLNDIEHRILRPIWEDPRTHYAVNCASLGCPNLNPTAFTADNTEQLLSESARLFINHPRAVRVTDKGLELSSIYKWFRADFGDDLMNHLRQFADEKLRDDLNAQSKIRRYNYDWSLNNTP